MTRCLLIGFASLVLSACGTSAGGTPAGGGGSDGAAPPDGGGTVLPDGGDTAVLPADDGSAPPPGDGGASRCVASPTAVSCPMAILPIDVGGGITRNVDYQLPLGTPSAAGWPVVFMFQGSFFSATHDFNAVSTDPFGAYYQALTLKALLDAGYAVLAPETAGAGSTYWDTNIPPYASAWQGCPDDVFMQAIFAAMGSGGFGLLDGSRLYATGISSGGYMTSRMAVSYAGKFKSLAICSASYATCAGAVCVIPTPLPSDHPPTLFLHGSQDTVVPISTMQAYDSDLQAEGHTTNAIVDPNAGHQWIAQAPAAITAWFAKSP